MTENEFEALSETFGGDLSRWPADQQREAARLLTVSARCRTLIKAEAALDERMRRGFGKVPQARVAALAERLGAVVQRPPRLRDTVLSRPAAFLYPAMLAAGLLIGLAVPLNPLAGGPLALMSSPAPDDWLAAVLS